MANVNIVDGGVVDASNTDNTVTFQNQAGTTALKTGVTVWNKGTATVYIKFNSSTVTATNAEEVNKIYLDAGDAVRLPNSVQSFAHKTASGTAKLQLVRA
jgi:uncharacterized cupredoxin-like copper-binding protein